jgi:hypothetical protein
MSNKGEYDTLDYDTIKYLIKKRDDLLDDFNDLVKMNDEPSMKKAEYVLIHIKKFNNLVKISEDALIIYKITKKEILRKQFLLQWHLAMNREAIKGLNLPEFELLSEELEEELKQKIDIKWI